MSRRKNASIRVCTLMVLVLARGYGFRPCYRPSISLEQQRRSSSATRRKRLPFLSAASSKQEEANQHDRNEKQRNGAAAPPNGESTASAASRKEEAKQHDRKEKKTIGSTASPNGESTALHAKEATEQQPKKREQQQPKRKRRKNADYPRFTYNSKRDTPCTSGKQYRVRFLSSSSSEEQGGGRGSTTSSSRVVSVPQMRTLKKEEPYWKRVLMSSFGPTLDATGIFDTERILPTVKQTRLLNDRAYARMEPFAAENITVPPSLDDLAARTREPFEGFWISTPARILSFAVSYFSFPYLTKLLADVVTMKPEQLDDVTSKFAPGISILYGTFISLTLSILYNRQKDIQDNVALECSLLTTIARTLLSLFRESRDEAVEAGQCVADQVRTLVKNSRGSELMLLMYSDPYARLLELVDSHEESLYRKNGGPGSSAGRMAYARDVLKDLCKIRANRLSDESLALPPTHFQILNILTVLILLGYTISILPTVPKGTGEPLDESCILFGVLVSVYVLFYNFASDLNNPFRGVYQLRRSCAASHLLEIKWLIANHPYLRGEVDFEESVEEAVGVQIRSPGLGDFWFERDDIYVDGLDVEQEEELPLID